MYGEQCYHCTEMKGRSGSRPTGKGSGQFSLQNRVLPKTPMQDMAHLCHKAPAPLSRGGTRRAEHYIPTAQVTCMGAW